MRFHVLNNSVVLNYLGKTVTVASDDTRYDAVIVAIREGRLDDIPAIVEVERAFEGSGFELKDGVLTTADGESIPVELNARILQYKELGLPYQSLLNFWDNLKQNPSYNARQMLFNFLSHNGHPLTDDGCFIAYRGVTEDFKDVHTKTFDNSIGAICEMPRNLVDDNPNNTCSAGLHVAAFQYAKDFGKVLVEVKVNPKDVVCVPVDYNGTKMRTCKFEVLALCEEIRKDVLYGHEARTVTYEELTDTETEVDDDDSDEDDSCSNCGHDVDSFHNFCPECGESVND